MIFLIIYDIEMLTHAVDRGKTRVPTAQGKQGKWQTKIPVRENTGNLEILSKPRENTGNFVKTQGKHREFC